MVKSLLPSVKDSPAWWRTLPEDFYQQADGTVLDSEQPFKVYGTALLDRGLRGVLSLAICGSMAPKLLTKGGFERESELLDFYVGAAELHDADWVFQAPDQTLVEERRPPKIAFTPAGVDAVELCFESQFVPLNPALEESYLGHKNNKTARAMHWRHPGGPRPTLIFVHGVIGSWYAFNSMFFSLKQFYDDGYDIVMMTLPFHGDRAERCDLFSGYGLFAGGLAQMNEAMLQSVYDIRVFIDYLYRRGAPQVGISGLSLGGYISALTAVVEPRLAFCIPNSPVVAPLDTVRSWPFGNSLMEMVRRRTGLSPLDMRQSMALHSPLTYQPMLDPDRVMIIGGSGDRFTPPRFVKLLHAHWPEAHLHWFPGNHIIHLGQAEYLQLMKQFMDSHCQPSALR